MFVVVTNVRISCVVKSAETRRVLTMDHPALSGDRITQSAVGDKSSQKYLHPSSIQQIQAVNYWAMEVPFWVNILHW